MLTTNRIDSLSDEYVNIIWKKNEAGVVTKKGKPIKTVLRFILGGPVGHISK